MTDNRPRPSRALRERVFALSGGLCQRPDCDTDITLETFHVSHLRSHVHGGPLVEENLEAWCPRCNFKQRAEDVRDTRVSPREWQLEALDPIVTRIMNDGAATLSAAPGAGKTIFAGLVFEALREADVVDRLIVIAPRLTIVDQWVDALKRACHIELKPFAAVERPGQDGVVVTYQSLTEDRLDVHRMKRDRALLVLDEVHHVGEPTKAAWARSIAELAGSVSPRDLHVAGVLNLSGTLWRSNRSERISTIRYKETEDGRLVSQSDYDIPADKLIENQELRPIDLYRLDARVRIQDWVNLDVIDTNMADLDERQAGAALQAAAQEPEYRSAFVGSVLDRLEEAHRSLGYYHVKALIVAALQVDARAFRQEVDDQMRARGLNPLAEIATSDEPEAKRTLERFRRSKRVGVLCTVDMAGEGYDCPDICVIGYATNKRTTMYVRQVVARAMRITERERELGIIPAKIVLPDVNDLVQHMLEYLKPFIQEVIEPPPPPPPPPPREPPDEHEPKFERWNVDELRPTIETVSVTHSDGEVYNFLSDFVDAFQQELERANVQPSLAPRVLMAARRMAEQREASRPFDSLDDDAMNLRSVSTDRPVDREPTGPSTIEDACRVRQDRLRKMEGWWVHRGNPEVQVSHFAAEANQAAGLPSSKGRDTATPEQLDEVIAHERSAIRFYCQESRNPVPPWL